MPWPKERAQREGKRQVSGGPEDAPLSYEFYLLFKQILSQMIKNHSAYTRSPVVRINLYIMMCISQKISISSHIYIYIYSYMHIMNIIYIYIYIYIYLCVCIYIYIYMCVRACICMCVCVCVCVCVCKCVCICV